MKRVLTAIMDVFSWIVMLTLVGGTLYLIFKGAPGAESLPLLMPD